MQFVVSDAEAFSQIMSRLAKEIRSAELPDEKRGEMFGALDGLLEIFLNVSSKTIDLDEVDDRERFPLVKAPIWLRLKRRVRRFV